LVREEKMSAMASIMRSLGRTSKTQGRRKEEKMAGAIEREWGIGIN